jgi:glycosyltransferase involved in cell wall biosynthesis
MRIVHIISSLGLGGAESLLYEQVRRLHEQGVENYVVYMHPGVYQEPLEDYANGVYQLRGLFSYYDPVAWWRLAQYIRALNPDCMHTWLWAANFMGRIVGFLYTKPVVCSLHNNVDQNGLVRNTLDRLTWGLATSYVAVSRGIVDSVRSERMPLGKVPLHTIYNGIDTGEFFRAAKKAEISRSSLGLTQEHTILGSVGRFVPLKNYELLIRAYALVFKEHPQARLVLVGSGPQEAALRTLTKTLNIDDKVVFVVGQRAYGYYRLFDLFVMSSYKEGISIALLEAISCNVPCIITNDSKNHEVIEDGKEGVVIDVYTPDIVAQKISAVLADSSLARRYALQAAKKIAERFSLESMVNAYVEIYKTAIKEHTLD